MKFRKAETRDIDDILEIISQAREFMRVKGIDQWQVGAPTREIFEDDIKKGFCFIIEIDGESAAVGVVRDVIEEVYEKMSEGSWLTQGSRYAVINRTAVTDKYRGRGMGEKLISYLENKAAELGCVSVRIDTHEDNAPMRGILEKHGFVRCGRVFWGEPDDQRFARLTYEKIL